MSGPKRNTGFGEKYIGRSKRIINKDGSFNIERTGFNATGRDMYQYLINLSWWRFLGFLFIMYVVINTVFACAYMLVGIDQLSGIHEESVLSKFAYAFFFSAQTMTTVGYGALNPQGLAANLIATFEAFVGLAGIALMTGLLYGRFSRPNSKLLYSENAIVAPHKDGISLQFRIVNKRSNVLMEMNASVLITIMGDNQVRKYYQLPLETPSIYFFPLNWTLVHVVSESSPMYGLSKDDLIRLDAEILILIKGFDDSFGQVVHSRYSYKAHEIVFGAKFKKAYGTDETGNVVIDINGIHATEPAELPVDTREGQLMSS